MTHRAGHARRSRYVGISTIRAGNHGVDVVRCTIPMKSLYSSDFKRANIFLVPRPILFMK